jgi:hypothetical protein
VPPLKTDPIITIPAGANRVAIPIDQSSPYHTGDPSRLYEWALFLTDGTTYAGTKYYLTQNNVLLFPTCYHFAAPVATLWVQRVTSTTNEYLGRRS